MAEPPTYPDCTCANPKPEGKGNCGTCGGFACHYANAGQARCPKWRCDCFIEEFPDSPFDLHPEVFTVISVEPKDRS